MSSPLTRQDLREELAATERRSEKRFATKAELDEAIKPLATKKDLERFATKKDLEQYATNDNLNHSVAVLEKKIDRLRFDLTGEIKASEERIVGAVSAAMADLARRAEV